jgi:hypothetical protein
MTWADINRTPSDRLLRQFAAIGAVVALALAIPRTQQGDLVGASVFAVLALIAAIVGATRPQGLKYIFVGLSFLTFPIGWVVSQVMLLVLFGLVVTPLAAIFRLTGRDRLWLRANPSRASLWKPRSETKDAARYLRQY